MALDGPRRPLQRSTGLRPGAPPKRRTRLRQVSPRRVADSPARAAARARVFARDGHRCLLAGYPGAPPCWGPLTFHHLRKAGQGGPYNELNGVTLCAGHNSWVETVRILARRLGLEMRRGDTYDQVWAKLAAAGLVTYHWTGAPLTL